MLPAAAANGPPRPRDVPAVLDVLGLGPPGHCGGRDPRDGRPVNTPTPAHPTGRMGLPERTPRLIGHQPHDQLILAVCSIRARTDPAHPEPAANVAWRLPVASASANAWSIARANCDMDGRRTARRRRQARPGGDSGAAAGSICQKDARCDRQPAYLAARFITIRAGLSFHSQRATGRQHRRPALRGRERRWVASLAR